MNTRTKYSLIALLSVFVLAVVSQMVVTAKREWDKAEAERIARERAVKETTDKVAKIVSMDDPKSDDIKDSWGNDIRIAVNDGALPSVEAKSAGPDGTFGTEDDITEVSHKGVDFKQAGLSLYEGIKSKVLGGEDKKE